jgi:hypothetical protein
VNPTMTLRIDLGLGHRHWQTFELTHHGAKSRIRHLYRILRNEGVGRDRARHVVITAALAMAPYPARRIEPDWIDAAWKPVLEGVTA